MDHDYDIGIGGIIVLTIMGILQYLSGKHAGRQEIIEQTRDEEVAALRRKIEEFERSRRC